MTSAAAERCRAELEGRAPTDPGPFYAWLRENAPVYRHPQAGACFAARHDDVAELLRDRRLVAQGPGAMLATLSDPHEVQRLRPLREFYDNWMVFSSGQSHELVRAALRPWFASSVVSPVLPDVGRLAADLTGRAAEFDVLGDLGRPIAEAVVGSLVGLDDARLAQLLVWSDAAVGFLTAADPIAATTDALDAAEGFRTTAAAIMERGGTWAAHALRAVGAVDPGAVAGVLAQVVTGTMEPLPQAIANAAFALLRSPTQLASWRSAPSRHGEMVEELVRLGCPFTYAPRTATEAVEIGGVRIEAGERVLALLYSANLDPEAFPDPKTLALDRRTTGVLSFGAGVHYCLGAAVARSVLQQTLAALFAPTHEVRLAGDAEPVASLGLHGLHQLPVRLTPAAPTPSDG